METMTKGFILAVVFILGFAGGSTFIGINMTNKYKDLKDYSLYQDSLIEEISAHCWEEHDCECGWYDGDYIEKAEYTHYKYRY